MSGRRSARSRKQIDYTKFEEDIDDDFADPTPPPAKKPKKTEKKVDTSKQTSKSSSSNSSRVPLDDKLYERDLQAALEISLIETGSDPTLGDAVVHSTPAKVARTDPDSCGVCGCGVGRNSILCSSCNKWIHRRCTEIKGPLKEDPNFSCKRCTNALLPLLQNVKTQHDHQLSDLQLERGELKDESEMVMPSAIPPANSVETDDDIEFLGTVSCSDADSPAVNNRTTARKRKSYTFDEDSDGSSEAEVDSDGAESSDSEPSDDADSDFDDSRTKSKGKGKGRQAPVQKTVDSSKKKTAPHPDAARNKVKPMAAKARNAPQAAVSPTATARSVPATRVSNTAASTTPASRAPSALRKTPAWTPPGHSSGPDSSSSLKSPPSGLRLGLSRHARIKPLHPSLKVS